MVPKVFTSAGAGRARSPPNPSLAVPVPPMPPPPPWLVVESPMSLPSAQILGVYMMGSVMLSYALWKSDTGWGIMRLVSAPRLRRSPGSSQAVSCPPAWR